MSNIFSDQGITFPNGDTQTYPSVPVRQTVLSGTVDSNGFSSFGGSTGSATVTASTTLIATAANGVSNRTGSIVNPSWTGLSTNGTMYAFMDINTDGTCTMGSGTLAPIYQWGGTPSATNGQFTFNIQEMKGYVGNGSTAVQTYRVYVGEVTVAGGVVTAIVWYALMGRYEAQFTATLPASGTLTSFNHNIGTTDCSWDMVLECTTANLGWSIGDIRIGATGGFDGGSGYCPDPVTLSRITISISKHGSFYSGTKTGGIGATLTNASWKFKFTVRRKNW